MSNQKTPAAEPETSRIRTLSRLAALGAALLFSTGGAAIKATALTSWQVASFRSAIAAAAIVLILPESRRGWNWRILLVSAFYAATMILYVSGNKLTTAANTIFLQATAPLFLLLAGPLLLKEKNRPRDLIYMVVMAAGMVLFFTGQQKPTSIAPNPALGNLLAAFSGLTWAATVGGLRWIGSSGGGKGAGIATVAAGNVLACVFCLPMALPVANVPWSNWLLLGYLGVFQIALAYLLLVTAVRHIPALEASLLLLLEPALNPIWTWMVHSERPGNFALAGGALILLVTLGRTIIERDSPPA